jgi:hypothetical protein
MIDAWDGAVHGAGENAFVNCTPFAMKASRFGDVGTV